MLKFSLARAAVLGVVSNAVPRCTAQASSTCAGVFATRAIEVPKSSFQSSSCRPYRHGCIGNEGAKAECGQLAASVAQGYSRHPKIRKFNHNTPRRCFVSRVTGRIYKVRCQLQKESSTNRQRSSRGLRSAYLFRLLCWPALTFCIHRQGARCSFTTRSLSLRQSITNLARSIRSESRQSDGGA
jgi:hypothetical protein